MVKSFRFLLQFAWVNLACLLGAAAVITAGAYLTGVPGGADNLFRTYFSTFPLMTLIILFIFAFAMCTSNLNLALSFGSRRRDFFWAVQGVLLVYAGVCWVLQLVMSAIPGLFGWSDQGRWTFMLSLGTGSYIWLYPLLCLAVLALGCLCGLVMTRSKLLGTLIVIAALLVIIACMVLLMLGANLELHLFSAEGMSPDLFPWGRLPLYLTLGMTAVLGASEAVIWRTVKRFMVR